NTKSLHDALTICLSLSKVLNRLRRYSTFNKLSDSKRANKMIATMYSSFVVPNVAGNLSNSLRWTTRLIDPPTMEVDDTGNFSIKTSFGEPFYVVGRGTERDFRRLSKDLGFSTDEYNGIRVKSRLSSEGDVRASLVILEYDQERKRIGELNIAPSSKVSGTFLPETRFILPTIR